MVAVGSNSQVVFTLSKPSNIQNVIIIPCKLQTVDVLDVLLYG